VEVEKMSKIVKIAVSGLGSVAQRGVLPHLSQPDIKDRVKLQAVMDIVEDRAKVSAEKFGAEEWYTDYDEMLAKADIDAVSLSSPIPLHFEQSLKAINSGKHVHGNKPITMTVDEATQLIEASAKAGVKVVASPGNSPILPSAIRMRELLKEKVVGEVYFAVVGGGGVHEYEGIRQQDDVLSDIDPTWYYTSPGPSLCVSSNTVYRLHTLISILGPVKRVTGFSGVVIKERTLLKPSPDSSWKGTSVNVVNDDNTLLVCDFGNSVYAYVQGGLSRTVGFPRFLVSCSKGSIQPTRTGLEINKWIPGQQTEPIVEELPRRNLPYVSGVHDTLPEAHVYNDIMHLVDCVINDKPPIVYDNVQSLLIARHVIEIGEKGWIAANTGQTQTLTTSLW
jgi:predicted dehydrogenase